MPNRRQQEMIEALRDHCAKHGVPPSLAELGAVVGMNRSALSYHMINLARLGLVSKGPGNRWQPVLPSEPLRFRSLTTTDQLDFLDNPEAQIPVIRISASLANPTLFHCADIFSLCASESLEFPNIPRGAHVLMSRARKVTVGDLVLAKSKHRWCSGVLRRGRKSITTVGNSKPLVISTIFAAVLGYLEMWDPAY